MDPNWVDILGWVTAGALLLLLIFGVAGFFGWFDPFRREPDDTPFKLLLACVALIAFAGGLSQWSASDASNRAHDNEARRQLIGSGYADIQTINASGHKVVFRGQCAELRLRLENMGGHYRIFGLASNRNIDTQPTWINGIVNGCN